MKIIAAPDSFKGSLSAVEAAAAIARGVRRALPQADVIEVPVADGGEGTLSCLLAATGGQRVEAEVTGPMGKPVHATYGLLGRAEYESQDESRKQDSGEDAHRNPDTGENYGGSLVAYGEGDLGENANRSLGAVGNHNGSLASCGEDDLGEDAQARLGEGWGVDDEQPVAAEMTGHVANRSGIAVVEMAEASGLMLVPLHDRNPLLASTYGTGQLLRHALDAGCRQFVLALGGSATNDGGAGMLQALGMKLLGHEGKPIAEGIGGGSLIDIAAIDDSEFDSRIAESRFIIATDVGSPFVGPNGASQVFGPQKGADPAMVQQLEEGMTAWADLIAGKTGVSLHELPGAGAAGGLGGAFLAFFPAAVRRGIDVIMDYTGLRRQLDGAALVLVGEGRMDGQTAAGKAPMGVALEAKRLGIPAIALAGSVGSGIEPLYDAGIVSAHSIVNGPMSLEEAMSRTAELLEQAAEQVVRTFAANRPSSSSLPTQTN
ncbi:glycerate kinase [Paenibacillus gorillae]|uniref:glycerate kinase n=1 Tax=Paenibacillus gorillae TaxID=1243662 RepID=UPI0004B76CB3|nr:glycerate kinase [Paenibacillus gorillae]